MMLPLLVNTIPENGSENVGLDQQISLEFTEDLSTDLAISNIQLINMNTDEEVVGIQPSVNTANNSLLEVVVPGNATGGHSYEGLTQYKLLVSNLFSASLEPIEGEIELRFTTKEAAIDDYVEEEESLPSFFSVIRSYPEDGSVADPDYIRLKFSEDVDESSDLTSIILVKGYSLEDAEFMGENNLLIPDLISIDSPMITIECPDLSPATNYCLSVSGVKSIQGDTVQDYEICFTSSFASMYVQVQDILKSKAVSILMKDVKEITIAGIINDNSTLSKFIAEESGNESIDWENPPLYVVEYVKYKTQYDIIFDKFIELSGNPTSKQLKDLTIEYGYSLSDLLDLADKLELRFKYWENYLKGSKDGKARPAAFRKGESVDEEPDFMDRMFTDIEGNKEW